MTWGHGGHDYSVRIAERDSTVIDSQGVRYGVERSKPLLLVEPCSQDGSGVSQPRSPVVGRWTIDRNRGRIRQSDE